MRTVAGEATDAAVVDGIEHGLTAVGWVAVAVAKTQLTDDRHVTALPTVSCRGCAAHAAGGRGIRTSAHVRAGARFGGSDRSSIGRQSGRSCATVISAASRGSRRRHGRSGVRSTATAAALSRRSSASRGHAAERQHQHQRVERAIVHMLSFRYGDERDAHLCADS